MRKSRPLGLRLYDRALVEILGQTRPQTAERDETRAGLYRIGGFVYRENGTPLPSKPPAPPVLLVYSTGCRLVRG
ncbi:hypothetical protein PQU92_17815 [Asticcacaulis sp. BYS171W]|uniref:Uncharacterized protein n=1 Tax=Asticcacaulis aquaticus TaxID=2984212 RepID=A0ABT5HYL3_9CAUL|nr:hypothetical protein [Asticcacaulis aquaticus]MDC7685144.1 hypothetical protein [Asticcacaulis aquaticus]